MLMVTFRREIYLNSIRLLKLLFKNEYLIGSCGASPNLTTVSQDLMSLG